MAAITAQQKQRGVSLVKSNLPQKVASFKSCCPDGCSAFNWQSILAEVEAAVVKIAEGVIAQFLSVPQATAAAKSEVHVVMAAFQGRCPAGCSAIDWQQVLTNLEAAVLAEVEAIIQQLLTPPAPAPA